MLPIQVEDQLAQLRQHLGSDDTDTKRERARVEKHQLELDRLAATLKQVREGGDVCEGGGSSG